MADIRVHRYDIDPADVDELVARRAELIAAMRARYAGLAETRLIRVSESHFIDTWRWDSAEQMQAALAGVSTMPEAANAMSLTQAASAEDGEIIDEQ